MKTQVLVIHGGDTFSKYEDYISYLKNKEITLEKILRKDWKFYLQEILGEKFEVIQPMMPNKQNAKYSEWKIWFDKIAPLLDNNVILVGHSLGAIFLPKYLAENKFPKKILGTFLIAAPYDTEFSEYSLADFIIPKDLSLFEKQGGEVTFYHSKDDKIVPFQDLAKYQKTLPKARAFIFEDRDHFNQPDFPELVADIKKLACD